LRTAEIKTQNLKKVTKNLKSIFIMSLNELLQTSWWHRGWHEWTSPWWGPGSSSFFTRRKLIGPKHFYTSSLKLFTFAIFFFVNCSILWFNTEYYWRRAADFIFVTVLILLHLDFPKSLIWSFSSLFITTERAINCLKISWSSKSFLKSVETKVKQCSSIY